MENTSSKIILDLFGGTGAWSKPYREHGYDVRIITLPKHDVRTFDPPANVYGILAAVPCDEFSLAKGSLNRDLAGGLALLAAAQKIIWQCQQNKKLAFWCIENPCGLMRQFLGKPGHTFQPWEYGDFHTKKTDLWGYFKTPKKTVSERPLLTPRQRHGSHARHLADPICPHEYKHLKLSRKDIRAITPAGFAEAFFKSNR